MLKNFMKSVVGMTAAVAMATSALAATANVATILNSSGKVFVQQGEGFVPVEGLVELKAGDQIMVGTESAVEIAYLSNGCTVNVGESTVVRITEKAPCAKGEQVAMVDSMMIQPTVGGPLVAPAVVAAFAALILLFIVLDDNESDSAS